MLIDTHCHLHDRDTYAFALRRANRERKKHPLDPADFTPDKMLSRAHVAGVSQLICVGTSHPDSLNARDFAMEHDGVFWAYGIHPDEAANSSSFKRHLATTEASDYPKLVAIGEIGLDYREGKNPAQIPLFEEMLQLATDLHLPCIFHVREAFPDFFAVLNNFPGITGVVHSFSDSPENLKTALNRGFYIGVNGLVTFVKPEIPLPPLEKMLLETDAPFLTPEPFRGTINEAAHVADVCAFIAKVKGESAQKIAEETTKNARELFKL